MFDMDNDGWNDIYVCNGVNRDVTNLDFMDFFANDVFQKNGAYGQKKCDEILKNPGLSHPCCTRHTGNEGNLKFSDSSLAWGFNQKSFANGAAYAIWIMTGTLTWLLIMKTTCFCLSE